MNDIQNRMDIILTEANDRIQELKQKSTWLEREWHAALANQNNRVQTNTNTLVGSETEQVQKAKEETEKYKDKYFDLAKQVRASQLMFDEERTNWKVMHNEKCNEYIHEINQLQKELTNAVRNNPNNMDNIDGS